MSNLVIHFEIHVRDAQRAAAFYSEVFGWDITRPEPEQAYWLAKTGPDSERGINGAFVKRTNEIDAVINTISVDDLKTSIMKVRELGGEIVREVIIDGVGQFAYCRDCEGNLFGMLQPLAG